MVSNKRQVVLSYCNSEADFALRLAADLKNMGVNLWIDRLDVQPEEDWAMALEKAFMRCSAVIAVLSPDYVSCTYCQHELVGAVMMGQTRFATVLKPVTEAQWPADLDRSMCVDFTAWPQESAYQRQLTALFQLLNKHTPFLIFPEPDATTQYLTGLIAGLEAEKVIAEHFCVPVRVTVSPDNAELRPRPVFDNSWLTDGQFEGPVEETEGQPEPLVFNGIREVALKYPRFVLSGPPGSGKTTLLNHLALEAAYAYQEQPNAAPLPLLVRFVDWQDEASPVEFIRARMPLDGDPVRMLATGKAVLFFDGISELGPYALGKAALLQQWLQSAQGPRKAVFTAHSSDDDREFYLGLPAVQAVPWDRARAREFIEHSLGADRARHVLPLLLPADNGHISELQRLLYHPFLLSILAHVCEQSPDQLSGLSTGALLEQLVDELWRRQVPHASLNYGELANGLSILAHAQLEAGQPAYVPFEIAESRVPDSRVLEPKNSSMFLRLADGHVRFSHYLVMQYFAALHIKQIGLANCLHAPEFDPSEDRLPGKWDTAIVLLAGIMPDPVDMLAEVAEVDPFLAMECVLHGGAVSEEMRSQLVTRLLQSPYVAEKNGRLAAARVLTGITDDWAVSLLLGIMRDGEWDARWSATETLRQITPPVPPTIRENLAEYLYPLDESALPALIQLIQHEDSALRQSTVRVLGNLQDAAAVPALVGALHDPDSSIVADAAEALSRLNDTSVGFWLQGLLHHEDWYVVQAAATALARLGPETIKPLLEKLRSANGDLRQLVIEALKQARKRDSLELLLEATYDDDVEVRSAAIEALEDVEGDVFVKRLVEALADTARSRWEKQRVCDVAAGVLEKSNSPEGQMALERWREGSPEGQQKGRARQERDGEQRMASDKRSASQAKERLTRITSQQPAAPSPASGLESSDWCERRDAVLMLQHRPEDEAMPALLRALNDDDNQVRIAAVQALAMFRSERALDALFGALDDEDYLVCDAVADALKRVGEVAIPRLLELLHSPRVNIRGAAIEVLAELADPSTTNALAACLQDAERPWLSDRRICDLAARALEAIATPESLQIVLRWRAEHAPDPSEVRQHQVEAERAALQEALIIEQDFAETGEETQQRQILLELLENLRHEKWPVRQDSAKALSEYAKVLHGTKDKIILEQLLIALQDDDWVVRWSVIEALAWIGDPASVPALLEYLNDANASVRSGVIRALREIEDKRAVPGIIGALSDSDTSVRETAAETLGVLGDHAATGALLDALGDRDSFVRLAAIDALGKMGVREAVEPLKAFMTDQDTHIRLGAASALGRIGDESAVPTLIEALKDMEGPYWEDRLICDVAAEALEAIGTEEALAAVEQWRVQRNASAGGEAAVGGGA